MSEEEIYKMLLVENIDKFPLLNEIFAIRNNKFKKNDYTIYVTGCISLDVINRAIEKVNLIEKLQKENEEYHRIKKELIRVNKKIYDVDTIDEFIKTIDKLQKENKESKELYNKLLTGYNKLVQEYLELEKENAELKEDNSHQWEERCRLTFELERLQEENEKINKVADKMYEYISYYGWEDFESNTGCNREEMVDYFYKE